MAGSVAVVAVVAAVGVGAASFLGGSGGVQQDSQGREVIAGVIEKEPSIVWSQDLSGDQWARVVGGRLVLGKEQRSTVLDLKGEELHEFDGVVTGGNGEFMLTMPDSRSVDGYAEEVVLLRADTGEEVWRVDAKAHDESAFRFTEQGLLTNATEGGGVVMLDYKDGAELWSIDDVKAQQGLWEEGNFVAAVTERDELIVRDLEGDELMRVDLDLEPDTWPDLEVSGDTLAVRIDQNILAFNVRTGEEIWQEEINLDEDYAHIDYFGSFSMSALPGDALLVEVHESDDDEATRFVVGADGEKRDYQYEAGPMFLFEEDGEEYAYLGDDESLVVDAQLEKVARVNDVVEHVKGGFYTLDDDRVGYVPFGDSKETWTFDLGLDSESYASIHAVPDGIVASWDDEVVILK